ncbi:hypothetical protein BSIN_2449 [Burkholderia singularis]|uniref:Uncharacterized protein n=1 Tax=Burkholderia singularis TaxID=1503053 RepID=A0A238H1V2_9BURK|nr:hypothetical protein BSIN_2449 [Burkholderia singularis]
MGTRSGRRRTGGPRHPRTRAVRLTPDSLRLMHPSTPGT